jgi:hypothetical protein
MVAAQKLLSRPTRLSKICAFGQTIFAKVCETPPRNFIWAQAAYNPYPAPREKFGNLKRTTFRIGRLICCLHPAEMEVFPNRYLLMYQTLRGGARAFRNFFSNNFQPSALLQF